MMKQSEEMDHSKDYVEDKGLLIKLGRCEIAHNQVT